MLSTASWAKPTDLINGLLAVMAAGASLVQVAHPDPAILQRRIKTEKITQILFESYNSTNRLSQHKTMFISQYLHVSLMGHQLTRCRHVKLETTNLFR